MRTMIGLGLIGFAASAMMLRALPAQLEAARSTYHGWKSFAMSNGLVELEIVPDIGGRVLQYQLGKKNFLWVNSHLYGKTSPKTGLTPDGKWMNYGGDKLWPAPQGWDNDQQWPGPPDAVLDGMPYTLEKLPAESGDVAIRLTSGRDPLTGIQFSRVVRLFAAGTHVSFDATMKNIDTKPRRWGIWAHTQLDAAKANGSTYKPLLQAWCPLNPQSHFPKGYDVIFGNRDSPSFQPDVQRGLIRVQYQYKVGKIGLDSRAGWVATVDGKCGAVFVQRFVFEPNKDYPDGSSVEFWENGLGRVHIYNKDTDMPTNVAENPYVLESELLSPYAELNPGQSYTWHYDWYACNVGGDYPVLNCTGAGVVAEPLTIRVMGNIVKIRGRFGVFTPGYLEIVMRDARGRSVGTQLLSEPATPLAATLLNVSLKKPADATTVTLMLIDDEGHPLGELSHVEVMSDERKSGKRNRPVSTAFVAAFPRAHLCDLRASASCCSFASFAAKPYGRTRRRAVSAQTTCSWEA